MIPEEEFACLAEQETSQSFFIQEQYLDFDCAGVRVDGEIEGYYERNNQDTYVVLDRTNLLGDSTEIMDLFNHFKYRRQFFVLSGNKVSGFVHYSDLNNPVVRVPFYALVAAAEHHCYSLMKDQITESSLERALKSLEFKKGWAKNRLNNIRRSQRKDKDVNMYRGWDGVLYINEILKLAQKHNEVEISDELIDSIREIRNRVSHNNAGRLIQSYEDVKLAFKVRNACRSLLP